MIRYTIVDAQVGEESSNEIFKNAFGRCGIWSREDVTNIFVCLQEV